MARRLEQVRLPTVPGTALRRVELAKGFGFRKRRGGKVDIIELRAKKPVATLECICQGTGSGCDVEVAGGLALCTGKPGGCSNCVWKVSVPQAEFIEAFKGVFAQ
jgi:hypothetical protein